MMLMIVTRRIRRCARLRVIHQAVRCRHASMRVWPIHTHTDGAERRHAHLNGEESDRHGIRAPASSSHGPLPMLTQAGLVGSDPFTDRRSWGLTPDFRKRSRVISACRETGHTVRLSGRVPCARLVSTSSSA